MIISATFKEAIDRLKLLERTETAFSHDSEDDEEKVKKAETVFRQKKLKKDVEEMKHLFNDIPANIENHSGLTAF